MNKLKTILPASLMIFIVVPVCAYLLESARFAEDDTPAFIGFGLIVAGGLLSAILHKCGLLNLIPLAVNSVGLGFCLRAWYIFRGFSNSLPVLLAACLIAWAFIPLFWLWSRIPVFDRHPALMSFIFIAPVTAVYCVLVFNTETTWLSTTGFCLIVAATVIFSMSLEANTPGDALKNMTYSWLGFLAAAVLILVACACCGDADPDCDCCDGCDCPISDRKSRKKGL